MDEKLKKLIESLEEIEGSLDNTTILYLSTINSEGRSYLDSLGMMCMFSKMNLRELYSITIK